MNLIYTIKEKYRLFGFKFLIVRGGLSVLKHIGINLDFVTFYQCIINYKSVQDKIARYKEPVDIRELIYEDFVHATEIIFDNEKLKAIQININIPDNKAFGVFVQQKMVAYCWLSYHTLYYTNHSDLRFTVGEDTTLLFDFYCAPDYRRRGLHTRMILHCLAQTYLTKQKYATTFVLSGNRFSLKGFLKQGFTPVFSYYTFSLRKWRLSNFPKKYEALFNQ